MSRLVQLGSDPRTLFTKLTPLTTEASKIKTRDEGNEQGMTETKSASVQKLYPLAQVNCWDTRHRSYSHTYTHKDCTRPTIWSSTFMDRSDFTSSALNPKSNPFLSCLSYPQSVFIYPTLEMRSHRITTCKSGLRAIEHGYRTTIRRGSPRPLERGNATRTDSLSCVNAEELMTRVNSAPTCTSRYLCGWCERNMAVWTLLRSIREPRSNRHGSWNAIRVCKPEVFTGVSATLLWTQYKCEREWRRSVWM